MQPGDAQGLPDPPTVSDVSTARSPSRRSASSPTAVAVSNGSAAHRRLRGTFSPPQSPAARAARHARAALHEQQAAKAANLTRDAARGASVSTNRGASGPGPPPFQRATRTGDEVGCFDSGDCKHWGTGADRLRLSWPAQVLLSGKVAKLATVVAVALSFATVRLAGSGKVVPDVRASRLTHVDDVDPGAVRAARENAARAQRRLAASATHGSLRQVESASAPLGEGLRPGDEVGCAGTS